MLDRSLPVRIGLPDTELATVHSSACLLAEGGPLYAANARASTPSSRLSAAPAKLLERPDSISFVGATHGQLHEQLVLALARRGETSPWRCIEIFALDDASLLRMTLSDRLGRPRSERELIEERELSLKQIGAYLTTKSIPQFFAAATSL